MADIASLKRRLDAMGERIAADKAERVCSGCRWFEDNFTAYRDKRSTCVNPAVRVLQYADREVPKRVLTSVARARVCQDNLLWETRRWHDGIRRWDMLPITSVACAVGIAGLKGVAPIEVLILLLVGSITSAIGSLFWGIHCSVEGRWSGRS